MDTPDEAREADREHEDDWRADESVEERAARIVDSASLRYQDRCDTFARTLRNNGRKLTPYKRRMTIAWIERHSQRLVNMLDEDGGIQPLGIADLPNTDF